MDRACVLNLHDRLLREIETAVYAPGATTNEPPLALFPWAGAQDYPATCSGVKLHTLLDERRNLPAFAGASVANLRAVSGLDEFVL